MKKNNPNSGTVSKIRGYSPIKTDFMEACQDKRTSDAVKEDTRHYILAIALGIIAIIFLSINAIQQTEIKKVESLYSSPIFNAPVKTAPIVTVDAPVTEQSFTEFTAPTQSMGGEFKSFEPVNAITDKTSKQWHLKQLYWIDSEGFCRFNEYYAVAMGTVHAKHIGQTFTIYLEGRTFKAIVGDFKDNKDVIDGVCKTNGSIVEFIVKSMDGDKLQKLFPGQVLKIEEAPHG